MVGCIGLSVDITDQKQVRAELNRSHVELRKLSSRLESVREEERRRLARYLHDELGQRLIRLKMDVKFLSDKFEALKEESQRASLLGETKSMAELIESSLAIVRITTAQLRPPLLDELGFRTAVEWHVKEFQEHTGIESQLNWSSKQIPLDRSQCVTVFRVLQEALINVYRHAWAKGVTIDLESKEGQLILVVTDDGNGMEKDNINHPNSLGIQGMRERADLLGGQLNIDSTEGKGTKVVLTVPSRKVTGVSSRSDQ